MSEGVCGDCPYGKLDESADSRVLCHHSAYAHNLSWFCQNHPLRRVHILAEKAMVGLLSGDGHDGQRFPSFAVAAKTAYNAAYAMIAEAALRLKATPPDFIERQKQARTKVDQEIK